MGKKLGLILGILNTVAVLAVLGLLIYTKVLFKRPAITESTERNKLSQAIDPTAVGDSNKRVSIPLDPITANLDPFQDGTGKKKVHYLSMSISVEIINETEQAAFEQAKPIILDRILGLLAKKKFEELNQVQGRYVFKSQIIDSANEYLGRTVVTEVYFSEFILQ
jgi:flagellar basal body-associated protein FliL